MSSGHLQAAEGGRKKIFQKMWCVQATVCLKTKPKCEELRRTVVKIDDMPGKARTFSLEEANKAAAELQQWRENRPRSEIGYRWGSEVPVVPT